MSQPKADSPLAENAKGQTLVETVAALAVTVIIITALVGMAVTSLRSSNLSRSKAIATQLLSEEIEKVRIYRDVNTFSGLMLDLGLTTEVCPSIVGPLYINSSQIVVSGSETVTSNNLTFSRFFSACLTDATYKVIEVRATVSWNDSAGAHPIKATTYFSNWR